MRFDHNTYEYISRKDDPAFFKKPKNADPQGLARTPSDCEAAGAACVQIFPKFWIEKRRKRKNEAKREGPCVPDLGRGYRAAERLHPLQSTIL
jgi:hypothetical protein